ncbi:hypothetical protein [Paraburkholderia atlantica]|uniref:hypothetical protein n=1 Tax=Paraburkholderia atlantica TaxID=2654982 RepID=UPI00161946A0|nr:hypothetical protein [Paraburkholderia atlantica]MBB5508160.1 hypothetical protein [Paraburkholderia atlantica]
MKFTLRAHEWLADHVSWVQYPNIRQISQKRPRVFWANPMPLGFRILFGTACLLMLMILVPVLAALAMGMYAFLGAAFNWY